MSLELSRRSFMKLSALSAVAVAGSALLSGCDDSSSTLYPSGAFGKKLSLMGEFTLSDPAFSNGTLTCNFTAKCTSSTPLAIRAKFFQVEVYNPTTKKTRVYNAESDGCSLTLGTSNYYLTKGSTWATTFTVTGMTLAEGETLSVMYFPRLESSSNGNGQAYTDLHATWKGTYKSGKFTN